MTEAEWLVATDPGPLLEWLRDAGRGRKLRLFALACCDRGRRFITDPRSAAAVAFAERHAESGVAGKKGRPAIRAAAEAVYPELDRVRDTTTDPARFAEVLMAIGGSLAAVNIVSGDDWRAADSVYHDIANSAAFEWARANGKDGREDWDHGWLEPEFQQQLELLRDIAGNPFRERPVAQVWRTSTVLGLAGVIYADAAFDRLPILADALEDAGCDQAELLAHLRGPGPHVRGCWALDLVLGKT